MTTVAVLAFLRGLLWAILIYIAVRHRDRLTILAVLFAWTSNILLANHALAASGVVGAINVALIVYLLADRLDKNPEHVKHVLAAQLHDARNELHDTRADARAWEARAVGYQRLLEKHNIHH